MTQTRNNRTPADGEERRAAVRIAGREQRIVSVDAVLRGFIRERLTDRQRQMTQLRYYENFTPAQIADMLGVDRSCVYKTLRRCEEKLREAMGCVWSCSRSYYEEADILS